MAKRKRRKTARGRTRRRRGSSDAERVVGFFASDGTNALCHEEACIITGTSQAMQQLLTQRGRRSRMTIYKTTFGEIRQGLQWGAAYGFDKQAYDVFRPLADRAGLPLVEQRLTSPDSDTLHVVRLVSEVPPSSGAAAQAAADVWLDDDGLHAMLPGDASPQAMLDELTRRYQQNIRQSPLWDQMVEEFGAEEAERMLQEFRAELG